LINPSSFNMMVSFHSTNGTTKEFLCHKLVLQRISFCLQQKGLGFCAVNPHAHLCTQGTITGMHIIRLIGLCYSWIYLS
jgi:hypothetical protein